ncbi:hypothetical protein L1887_06130 [Cichorium endivia]|nr:hypothetical protein L1887_06130 [Cichorium endivia]
MTDSFPRQKEEKLGESSKENEKDGKGDGDGETDNLSWGPDMEKSGGKERSVEIIPESGSTNRPDPVADQTQSVGNCQSLNNRSIEVNSSEDPSRKNSEQEQPHEEPSENYEARLDSIPDLNTEPIGSLLEMDSDQMQQTNPKNKKQKKVTNPKNGALPSMKPKDVIWANNCKKSK